MSLKKNLIAVGLSTAVLFTSVSTSATTYLTTTLTGTNAESGFKKLGSGTRYLKGEGKYGTGAAYAMRIVKFLPDTAQTSISVSKGKSASSKFTAKATNSYGENQSYYILWGGGTAKSSATLKLTD